MNQNDREYPVQKIRTQYTEKEQTELDELKALDRKVKRPADLFAYIFGSIGAVIMGSGMSFVMTDLAAQLGLKDMMIPGVIIGTVGLAMTVVNYPVYKKILTSRRKRYADEVLRLSDALLSE